MILRTKSTLLLKFIFIAYSATVFAGCKNPGADADMAGTDSNVQTEIETIEQSDTVTSANNQSNGLQWIYYKAVPIMADDATTSFNCDDAKYSALNISFKGDSVYLSNKFSDEVFRGNIKSKSFFEKEYLYNFYKKMLQKDFKLNLGDSISYVRNKKAYQKESALNSYFNDAFFLSDYMFAESGGCVYVYRKNPAYKQENKAIKPVSAEGFVTLPFDFDAYYKTCFDGGSAEDCKTKYPMQDFKSDAFFKSITTAFDGWEPNGYFKIPNKSIEIYLIYFQGDGGDEYSLVTVKNSKVVDKLTAASTGGENNTGFIIKSDGISLYADTNGKHKAIGNYTISAQGKFVKK